MNNNLNKSQSSYHGKVHIPQITTIKHISLGDNITLNSACANHVLVEEDNNTKD